MLERPLLTGWVSATICLYFVPMCRGLKIYTGSSIHEKRNSFQIFDRRGLTAMRNRPTLPEHSPGDIVAPFLPLARHLKPNTAFVMDNRRIWPEYDILSDSSVFSFWNSANERQGK